MQTRLKGEGRQQTIARTNIDNLQSQVHKSVNGTAPLRLDSHGWRDRRPRGELRKENLAKGVKLKEGCSGLPELEGTESMG